VQNGKHGWIRRGKDALITADREAAMFQAFKIGVLLSEKEARVERPINKEEL
jgi:hypothetical protein